MRIVDEETRRIVMQNRIDALEEDNLFDNIRNEEEEILAEEQNELLGSKRGKGVGGEYVVDD